LMTISTLSLSQWFSQLIHFQVLYIKCSNILVSFYMVRVHYLQFSHNSKYYKKEFFDSWDSITLRAIPLFRWMKLSFWAENLELFKKLLNFHNQYGINVQSLAVWIFLH
jgi:hypothetical protein